VGGIIMKNVMIVENVNPTGEIVLKGTFVTFSIKNSGRFYDVEMYKSALAEILARKAENEEKKKQAFCQVFSDVDPYGEEEWEA
jgi:hypothetical protein